MEYRVMLKLCWLLTLTLLTLAPPTVWATPDSKALLKAAKIRYPDEKTPNYSDPGRFGMARYILIRDGARLFAYTTCNYSLATVYRGSEPHALWESRQSRWNLIWSKEGPPTNEAFLKVGVPKGSLQRLHDTRESAPLRPDVLGFGPADPLAASLRQACLEKFHGPKGPSMNWAWTVPYGDSAFGITYGQDAGDAECFYAVWELKGGNWSWIFEFNARSCADGVNLPTDALYPLFARNGFSAKMCDTLMRGLGTVVH